LLRTQTDARLIDLTRAGQERAFEALVERYRRPLLRHCQRMLAGERAEDAVQQAFVSAYNALVADDRAIDLKPWLYRIAHNACLSALRQNGWNHEELGEEHDGVEAPDQAFERRERLGAMVASVKGLPDRQREAVVLRELEGRSYDEIATELGVSDGAVRQLLSRARVQLRAVATAIIPAGIFLRGSGEAQAAQAAEPMATRIAELSTGGAGVGAVLAKVSVTVLATGALVGGAAQTPLLPGNDDSNRAAAAATDSPRGQGGGKGRARGAGSVDDEPARDAARGAGDGRRSRARGAPGGHGREGQEDGRGSRDRSDDDAGDRDGPRDGGGQGDDDGNEGPGGGGRGGGDGHDFEGTGEDGGGTPGPMIGAYDDHSGDGGGDTSGGGDGEESSGSDGSGSDSSGSGSSGSGSNDSSGSGSGSGY